MTYLNAKKYVWSAPIQKSGEKSDLPRILDRLGSPHRRLKYLRLAGSNGKTVCAEMLRSVLGCAGYTVGCLRLPLREEPRENICIGSTCIGMEDFVAYISEIRSLCAEGSYTLTRSELLLAASLLAFRKADCHICLLECGSIADTQNSLPPPFAAVICGTIPSSDKKEIAKIRSYITKGIEEIVSAPQDSEAYKIILETCYNVGCRPPTTPEKNAQSVQRLNFRGCEFTYKNQAYSLRLCGRFQISNAILVLKVIEMLERHGYRISNGAVREGLSALKIPSKFEVLSISPLIIADSSHAPIAIKTVCDALAQFEETVGKRVLLCLPEGSIIDGYYNALSSNGYEIEGVFTLPCGGDANDAHAVPVTVCKNARALAKSVLAELTSDKILLISGQHPFVTPVRYELLAALGF